MSGWKALSKATAGGPTPTPQVREVSVSTSGFERAGREVSVWGTATQLSLNEPRPRVILNLACGGGIAPRSQLAP